MSEFLPPSNVHNAQLRRGQTAPPGLGGEKEAIYRLDSLLISYQKICKWQSEQIVPDDNENDREIRNFTSELEYVLCSEIDREAILTLGGNTASLVLDLLLKILHDWLWILCFKDRKGIQRDAHRLLVKLARNSSELPGSLHIDDIHLSDSNPVGSGGFAEIFLGTYKGAKIAIKRHRVYTGHTIEQRMLVIQKVCQEALIWRSTKHDNILPLYGVNKKLWPECVCLVSPWMENGTVISYIGQTRPPINSVDTLIREIAAGLQYLHERYIVHGDLRGTNVLVDGNGHARIADFGLSVNADATQSTNHNGSTQWMAPELLMPSQFDKINADRTIYSDVYSFAMTCVEMYSGNPPFSDIPIGDIVSRVLRNERPDRPPYVNNKTPMLEYLWTVVRDCWKQYAADRPNIKTICQRLASPDVNTNSPSTTSSWSSASTLLPDISDNNGREKITDMSFVASPIAETSPVSPIKIPKVTTQRLNEFVSKAGRKFVWQEGSEGPDHERTWTVVYLIDGVKCGRGRGRNLKDAKEDASSQILAQIPKEVWENPKTLDPKVLAIE